MCDIWLSRYTPKFDGSKISHLPIDQVYPTYVYYRKSKGNILIQMKWILDCKVHILVRFFVFESLPIHAGDCWILKRCEWKMKSCDFYEELWLLWNVATFMKSCDFYEKLRLLWKIVTWWKVVTFMKGDDLSERLWLFQRFVTFPVKHNKNLFALSFVLYKLRDFLSF